MAAAALLPAAAGFAAAPLLLPAPLLPLLLLPGALTTLSSTAAEGLCVTACRAMSAGVLLGGGTEQAHAV